VKSGSVQTGASSVASVSALFPVDSTANGLEVNSGMTVPGTVVMTSRLYDWLTGLRLLRNVPLAYLIPDSDLLPPESIRFFHVDPTWVDRIIDGVFSAANTGTIDVAYSVGMLEMVRNTLDQALGEIATDKIAGYNWTPAQGISGMLIRSDLVRRWPDMGVSAYTGTVEADNQEMPVLRCDAISKDILIALFAGQPKLVELREPHVGVRFGLETLDQKTFFYENRSTVDGSELNTTTNVTVNAWRTVPVRTIATGHAPGDPRAVALQIMRPPFVQQFLSTVTEPRGSENPPATVTLRYNRVLNTTDLLTRQAALQRLGKS